MIGISSAEFLAVAKEQIGTTEGKGGVTKYGKWYGDRVANAAFDAAAWCDMSLAWIAYEAGRRKGGEQVAENALKQAGCFAYTVWHAQWFAKKGRFGTQARKGAFVYFDWGASKGISAIDHVGVVAGRTSDGLLITYEGNVSNGFRKLYRSYRNIVGFGYPSYAEPGQVEPEPAKDDKPSVKTAPKFPLPSGHYFGIKSAIPECHAGTTPVDKKNIRLLQSRLKERGWKITVDGEFGPQTKAIVMDFQADKGVKADGLVGARTWPLFWTAPIT
ncbi:peptidoglycan-binding domain-containing protein [Nonomuraea sp. SYSU D8015]|uniref:peptidoglycan-binding domain-containing protein n=1 Tax=Nonomuraea sp. SYSU D8015 TaxID=2593644 RepID=UPI001661789D|nr:peptidoglycan-binding domain-containing protein [Nonomuraea sp. SYSU D8015]